MVDIFPKNGATPFCITLANVLSLPTMRSVIPSMIGIITPRTPAMPTSRINVHMALRLSAIILILSPLKDIICAFIERHII